MTMTVVGMRKWTTSCFERGVNGSNMYHLVQSTCGFGEATCGLLVFRYDRVTTGISHFDLSPLLFTMHCTF